MHQFLNKLINFLLSLKTTQRSNDLPRENWCLRLNVLVPFFFFQPLSTSCLRANIDRINQMNDLISLLPSTNFEFITFSMFPDQFYFLWMSNLRSKPTINFSQFFWELLDHQMVPHSVCLQNLEFMKNIFLLRI